jgi:hypothetical protein
MMPSLLYHNHTGLDSLGTLQTLQWHLLLLPLKINGHWRVYISTLNMGLQLVSARLGDVHCRSADKECRLQEQYMQ